MNHQNRGQKKAKKENREKIDQFLCRWKILGKLQESAGKKKVKNELAVGWE